MQLDVQRLFLHGMSWLILNIKIPNIRNQASTRQSLEYPIFIHIILPHVLFSPARVHNYPGGHARQASHPWEEEHNNMTLQPLHELELPSFACQAQPVKWQSRAMKARCFKTPTSKFGQGRGSWLLALHIRGRIQRA